MAVDDPGEDVGQVGERIDLVEFTSLDQGRDDGPMLGTAVRACEQRIGRMKPSLAERMPACVGRATVRRLGLHRHAGDRGPSWHAILLRAVQHLRLEAQDPRSDDAPVPPPGA
jgi:hypothetical protein